MFPALFLMSMDLVIVMPSNKGVLDLRSAHRSSAARFPTPPVNFFTDGCPSCIVGRYTVDDPYE